MLYVRGRLDVLNTPAFAIVGTRSPTARGAADAAQFAQALSEAGLTIVSGLADGIDAAAHRGGLRAAASSVAVLGTGLDRVYPAKNRALAHELAESGALVSEFALGTPPLPDHFPRRNRIISGLSLGCLVVEAAMHSGSLITARCAVEQGRDVFALPGSIHSPQSKGCHWLIKQGAKLVDDVRDVLDELAPGFGRPIDRPADVACAQPDSPILNAMDFAPMDLDTICQRTNLTPDMASAMLLMLELDGHVARLAGGLYQRLH